MGIYKFLYLNIAMLGERWFVALLYYDFQYLIDEMKVD
jgi:hypothetical protein